MSYRILVYHTAELQREIGREMQGGRERQGERGREREAGRERQGEKGREREAGRERQGHVFPPRSDPCLHCRKRHAVACSSGLGLLPRASAGPRERRRWRRCTAARPPVGRPGSLEVQWLGCSGMWCLRTWGFKLLIGNPSAMSALGVKSPHLQFLRVNQLIIMFKPHILNTPHP